MLTTTLPTLSLPPSISPPPSRAFPVGANGFDDARKTITTVQKVIIGVVIGVFCLLIMIMSCITVVICLRRKRVRQMGMTVGPSFSRPKFGWILGGHNRARVPTEPQPYFNTGGNNVYNPGGGNNVATSVYTPFPQQPYNPGYPPPSRGNTSPPPYGTEPSVRE